MTSITLAEYLSSLAAAERLSFAQRCRTSTDYLGHVAAGRRTPKVDLAVAIERESGGRVLCETLLPNVDWAYLRAPREAREHAA